MRVRPNEGSPRLAALHWGAVAVAAKTRLLPARHGWLGGVFYFFFNLGAFGLVLLSALDSSFLTLPFANDILVIVLASLHRDLFYWYAIAASLGSILGTYVMYWVGRKGGETFIQAHLSPRRYAQLRAHVSSRAPEWLAVPALIPPPFPYTAWVLAAGALDVPRNRFLWAVGAMRFVRFFAEAILAVAFGRGIVRWLNTPSFRYFIDGMVGIAALASAYSIYRLVRATRRRSREAPQGDRRTVA